MQESYILTLRELHFGHIKETFGKGAVITVDRERRMLVIDGRKFDDTRDLDVLIRQARKFPDKPWIVPYSEENLEIILGQRADRKVSAAQATRKTQPLAVVKSDEDEQPTIDISDTKISQRNREARDAERQQARTGKLEVIKGDESVEERIARLKQESPGDPNAIAERVRLMNKGPAQMRVVKDDSLGYAAGSKGMALNAGQVSVPSTEELREKETIAKAEAQARKEEADRNRQKILQDEGLPADTEVTPFPMNRAPEVGGEQAEPAVETEAPPSTLQMEQATPANAEVESLRQEVGELKNDIGDMKDMMGQLLSGMKKGSAKAPKSPVRAKKIGARGE